LKALSVRQPWAWLLAHGHKNIENRVWPTKYTGDFLIHAGKKMEEDMKFAYSLCHSQHITLPTHFDRGGFIGVARITGCVTNSNSPWFEGPFGFVISDARPLPFYPYRGLLKLWEVRDFEPPAEPLSPLARKVNARATHRR